LLLVPEGEEQIPFPDEIALAHGDALYRPAGGRRGVDILGLYIAVVAGIGSRSEAWYEDGQEAGDKAEDRIHCNLPKPLGPWQSARVGRNAEAVEQDVEVIVDHPLELHPARRDDAEDLGHDDVQHDRADDRA